MKAIHSHFSYRLIYKFSLPQHKIPSIGCLVFVSQFDHKIVKFSFLFIDNSLLVLCFLNSVFETSIIITVCIKIVLFIRFKIKSGRREISHVSIETRFSTNQRSLTINVIYYKDR